MARNPRRRRRNENRKRTRRPAPDQPIFYAFPQTPPALRETIESAIVDLKQHETIKRDRVTLNPWPALNITGKILVSQITNGIDNSNVVAFDLTYGNHNVAFELGYAIGKFKRIWISLNTGVEDASRSYKRRYTGLLGAGYAPYHNHQELAEAFLRDAPWTTLDETILSRTYQTRTPRSADPTLLYVKPPLDTDSVIAIGETIRQSVFASSFIVDDPNDNRGAGLDWYAETICDADAVLVHLLSNEDLDSDHHNGKASFVAGLAHGLGKHVLMLARDPFECPADFESLLGVYNTAHESVGRFETWAETREFPRRRARYRTTNDGQPRAGVDVRQLALGDHVAEHEGRRLDDYFVETETYAAAQRPGLSIIVGRRGSGKTATLIALEEAFRHNQKVHVCAVSPVGYEVAGVLRLLAEAWHESERGFLVESLWKFLLYSELAASVVSDVKARPPHYVRTEEETQLVRFVEDNQDVLTAPFSQRVSRAVAALSSIDDEGGLELQRLKISEHLHKTSVGRLRRLLGRVLANKDQVLLLVDRLDEQWRSGVETDGLASLLLGLFRVAQSVISEFRDEVEELERVNLSLGIFIRSDIFAHVGAMIPERDKLPIHRIVWSDPELLIRVLNERLVQGRSQDARPEDVWDQFFPDDVGGLPAHQFITQRCLPKPRDVLVLTKQAVRLAVERSHPAIMRDDVESAYEEYSRYVLESVSVEDDPRRGQLESILYELAGSQSILPESEIRSRIAGAGVTSDDTDFYIELLCDVNVLGIRTSNDFVFQNDEDHRHHLMTLGKVLARRQGWGELSYRVHPAFHPALEIAAAE